MHLHQRGLGSLIDQTAQESLSRQQNSSRVWISILTWLHQLFCCHYTCYSKTASWTKIGNRKTCTLYLSSLPQIFIIINYSPQQSTAVQRYGSCNRIAGCCTCSIACICQIDCACKQYCICNITLHGCRVIDYNENLRKRRKDREGKFSCCRFPSEQLF